MTFTGFAKRRNRIQSSPPQTREQRQIQAGTDQFLSDLEQRKKLEKEAATQALDSLRAKFQADQSMRQSLFELQSEQSQFRREQERNIYESEIARLDAASAEKDQLFESISGISKTASDYLLKQAEDRAENEIKFGQGSALKFGLTPNEVSELAELERGLDQYRLSDIPIIQKLRDMGASETELEQLIGVSGWAKEGAVRTAVQNAGSDYAGYLSENAERKVLINGNEVSLADAERSQSLEMQAAVLDKLKGEFFDQYLPNVKPEYIANYSKQQFSIADAQRKKALSETVEESAAKANAMSERMSLLAAVKANASLQDPSGIASSLQTELAKIGALDPNNPGLVKTYFGYIATSVENKSLDVETAEKFLTLNGVNVQFTEFTKPIRDAITVRRNEVRQAFQDQETFQNRIVRQVEGKAEAEFEQMIVKGEPITPEYIDRVADQLRIQKVDISRIGAVRARLSKYLRFNDEHHNDEKFIRENADFFAGLASDVTITDIMQAGLSPELTQKAAGMVESIEYARLPKDKLTNKRREIKNRLAEVLFQGRKKPGEISSTLEPATDYVLDLWHQTYTSEFRKDGNAGRAEQVANNKVNEEILKGQADKQGKEMLSRQVTSPGKDGSVRSDREFGKFITQTGQTPILSPSRNDLVNKVTRDPDVIYTEQLIPVEALKQYAFEAQTSLRPQEPAEWVTIYKATGIDPGKIIKAQLDIARRTDPSIPEVPLEVFQRPRQNIEAATQQSLEQFTTKIKYIPSDLELSLDRDAVFRGRAALFSNEDARANPQASLIRHLQNVRGDLGGKVGFPEEDIVKFLAIMYAESGDYGGWDSAKRENSEERSYGRLQINTLVHRDFLATMGFTPQDMFNPEPNMKVAVALYRRRLEAGDDPFSDWGAYTNGSYLNFMEQARQDLQEFKESPTGYQNRNNYHSDISDEDAQSLGVIPYQSSLQVGSNSGIVISWERDPDPDQPGTDFEIERGKRGAKFFWPYRSEVIRVNRGANANYIKGSGQSGYGNFVDILTTLPSGNRTQVRIAHFDDVNTQLQVGMMLPANTFLGTQGTTGSTNGAPHISADFYHESEYSTHNEAARIEFLNAYLKPLNNK